MGDDGHMARVLAFVGGDDGRVTQFLAFVRGDDGRMMQFLAFVWATMAIWRGYWHSRRQRWPCDAVSGIRLGDDGHMARVLAFVGGDDGRMTQFLAFVWATMAIWRGYWHSRRQRWPYDAVSGIRLGDDGHMARVLALVWATTAINRYIIEFSTYYQYHIWIYNFFYLKV
ncbi:hypothetical protein [Salinicoccus halodurans]|uniref:hypothetical protein n=1 Tax=Salinicoccus halodurans TaxID=407035 RepID=UPI00117BC301|nr:hypothetical protein [Salinicoccus halodurans]